MKWRKLGRIYVADGFSHWAKSHAYIPTPYILDESHIRIYVAFLDSQMVGRIGYVELDINNPCKPLSISDKPVLDIGEPGTFDDNGVNPSCIIRTNKKTYLYYIGWQRGVLVRYYLLAGLAISDKNGLNFAKHARVPALERNNEELILRSAPCVIVDQGIYKMWYVSGSNWIHVKDKIVPTYNLRYLESKDGISWAKEGQICLKLSFQDEYGFGRPWVIKDNSIYKIWYSIRSKSKLYRIGYAESTDGLSWERKDNEAGIDVSTSGWDSEMVGMTSIVDIKGQRYMFYNGNDYGRTGFGIAVLES